MGIGRIRYSSAAVDRAINTRHKTLIHEMIDDKKIDGYTFGEERRKSKTGKIYGGYLYRQKWNVNGKAREHISLKARDLEDYRDNVLREQAKQEVFKDMGGWGEEGLTLSEMKTFHTLKDECWRIRKQDDRNPVAQRYIKQLGLKMKNRRYRIITSDGMIIEKQKNILKAAKKALDKRDKSRKKLMRITDFALNRDYSPREFIDFMKNVVLESKCRNNVKMLQQYIDSLIARDGNSPYSILKPSELKSVAKEILWIGKSQPFSSIRAWMYHKNEKNEYL
jgi:hypothetical protein